MNRPVEVFNTVRASSNDELEDALGLVALNVINKYGQHLGITGEVTVDQTCFLGGLVLHEMGSYILDVAHDELGEVQCT